MKSLSRVRLFATPWTVACQAPLSMEFSRQVYWSGLPFPSPQDLPDQGIKPESPELAGRFFTTGSSRKSKKSSRGGLKYPDLDACSCKTLVRVDYNNHFFSFSHSGMSDSL